VRNTLISSHLSDHFSPSKHLRSTITSSRSNFCVLAALVSLPAPSAVPSQGFRAFRVFRGSKLRVLSFRHPILQIPQTSQFSPLRPLHFPRFRLPPRPEVRSPFFKEFIHKFRAPQHHTVGKIANPTTQCFGYRQSPAILPHLPDFRLVLPCFYQAMERKQSEFKLPKFEDPKNGKLKILAES